MRTEAQLFVLEPDFAAMLGPEERDFDALMNLPGTVVRAREGRATARFSRGGCSFYIKRHRGVGWGEIAKNLLSLRLPALSAQAEWEAAARLQQAGIATPRVVARGHRGRNPARLESFVVTEALEDSLTLAELAKGWREQPPDPHLKWALIREVAEIARRMHDSGVAHRDFYLFHFRRPRSGGRLYLMDLHRARIGPRLRRRWIVKDLGGLLSSAHRVELTRRDLYRFVAAYARRPLRSALAAEERLWRDVARNATALRLRREDPVRAALLLRFPWVGRAYRALLPESSAR